MTAHLNELPTECFIGGAWRPASDGARFDVDDPATGEIIASVASASINDGLAAGCTVVLKPATEGSCPTPQPPSVGSSRAVSAARAATKACSTTSSRST